jgi:hypothetical protein
MQSGKTTIFVNNSPKDGFREGDGDLMDKLTTELNTVSLSVAAVRIVCETQPADIERPEGQLVVIDDMPESKDEALAHLHPSQQKFVQHIIADPAENKILYLGSRIDSFRKDNNKSLSISVGSGAFVSEDMLVILKKHQVKMVVCCKKSSAICRRYTLFNSARYEVFADRSDAAITRRGSFGALRLSGEDC